MIQGRNTCGTGRCNEREDEEKAYKADRHSNEGRHDFRRRNERDNRKEEKIKENNGNDDSKEEIRKKNNEVNNKKEKRKKDKNKENNKENTEIRSRGFTKKRKLCAVNTFRYTIWTSMNDIAIKYSN